MKKILPLSAMLLLFATQHISAQVVTKYGDTVSSLSGIMKGYYDVVSVEKGGKVSYERDSLMHWPKVNVGTVGMNKSGKPVFHYISLKEFHRLSDPVIEKEGFFEREIFRKVEKFGAIYHVWSTYESRNTATGPVIERGINSIEMFYDGTRFWILGWFYDAERKQNPIPQEYLK